MSASSSPPWYIAKLPYMVLAGFVLSSLPVLYAWTASDVSSRHYDRIAAHLEAQPSIAPAVAEALQDGVLTHGEYQRLSAEARTLSAAGARARLIALAQRKVAASQTASVADALAVHP